LKFELGSDGDDAALRTLLRETPMPGSISLAFLREPSFFLAERAGNDESQVIVAREGAAVVGAGCRALRRMYVNGEETRAGYLSMLRGRPEVRGGTGLARGYRFLRKLHGDGRAPFYVTTILDDNRLAAALLTSGRAGMPRYERVGALRTYLIPLARSVRGSGSVEEVPVAEGMACVEAWNQRHQFAPVRPAYVATLYVHRRGGEIAGTLGVWDQGSFKQTIVASYAPLVAALRPLYNIFTRPALPRVGAPIRMLYATMLSAADDDPRVFDGLLDAAVGGWSGKGFDYLALGLARKHPLTPAVAPRASRTLDSTIYVVTFRDDERPSLDGRLPHLEIGTL
jgi:hypothetical protein